MQPQGKDGGDDPTKTSFAPRIGHLLKTSELKRSISPIPALKAYLTRIGLPTLIADVEERIDKLANNPSGITDPFDSIYRIVWKLTLRIVGANDIAEDPQMSEQTLQNLETLERSATATAIMFPKIPSLPILRRTYAGAKLYMTIRNIINKRKASGEKQDDPLQYLIDKGDSTYNIIEFILGSIFAGQLNSGINAAWVLVWLAKDEYWRGEVIKEVRKVAAKYAKTPSLRLRDQLADVPLEAWESEFPVIDLCLRESIRFNGVGNALRRNISGQDIPLGNGEVIPANAFATYAMADTLLNPSIYRDPEKFDPGRFLPDRAEDKKQEHAYIGWGVGRHPCRKSISFGAMFSLRNRY